MPKENEMTFEEWIKEQGWVHSYIDIYTQCEPLGNGIIITFSQTRKELMRDYKKYCKKIGRDAKGE